MKAEDAALSIFDIALQAEMNATERQFLPWNLVWVEKFDLKTFNAGRVVWGEKSPTVKEMDLVNMSDAEHGEGGVNHYHCSRFLLCFTGCTLHCCFAVFHESRGKCPESVAGFNSAPTK